MEYGSEVRWEPARVRVRPGRRAVAWVVSAAAVWVAAAIVPGFALHHFWAPFIVAAAIAILNAIVPPVLAALRLPYMLVAGFLLVLVADALLLRLADRIFVNDISYAVFCLKKKTPARSAPRRSVSRH